MKLLCGLALFFVAMLLLTQVECWLTIRCVEAGGDWHKGMFVDHCERPSK